MIQPSLNFDSFNEQNTFSKNIKPFKFIDLFSGIGGFHLALDAIGGECVFASEMDSHARQTYEHNFRKISPNLFQQDLFNDDIRNIAPSDIPDFDILCAGFPCQPFSQAGHKRGFEDNHKSERGNLFFNIVDIIEEKKPKAFFLENVRGLINHDNGNTFKIIKEIIEDELNYSFHYKVVKASDYGLPQLRPRIFMIGFREDIDAKDFIFPEKVPLKYNMSDIWQGNCSREIGFTMRVGGRGSPIDDRRNWDSYLVDGEVKRLGVEQGKQLQGFPSNYEFPVSNTQALKQLGNSVAIDAVQLVAKQILYTLQKEKVMQPTIKKTKNKGEWTELLVFVQLLHDQKFYLSDKDLNAKTDSFRVKKVSTHNLDNEFLILDKNKIQLIDKQTSVSETIAIQDILNDTIIENLKNAIVDGKKTFAIQGLETIQERLQITNAKGGNSNQKADILLDIENDDLSKENETFGIKSYLGSKPTLLNASGNTNFIFEVVGIDNNMMDDINNIDTRTKLKDRLDLIYELGGSLVYKGAEKDIFEYNLSLSDSALPSIIGETLIHFYKDRISKLTDIVDRLEADKKIEGLVGYEDRHMLEVKLKKFLVDILLGFFAGTKWDGNWESNGTLVVKKTGDLVGFHVIDLPSLKDYLFENIKLDTPSTTRHRFGKIYKETDNKLYFKLNLQLRF